MITQSLPEIDVHRYEGEWYVIGSKPLKRSRDWTCTRERYEWNDDRFHFDVISTHRLGPDSPLYYSHIRLCPVKNSHYARYKVRLSLLKRTQYVIYKVNDDYSHAVIGHPRRKHLYIIARKPEMGQDLYEELTDFAVSLGYKREDIRKHVQETH